MTRPAGAPRLDAAIVPADDPLLAAVAEARRPGAISAAWRRAWRSWTGEDGGELAARIRQTHYKPFLRVRFLVQVSVPPKVPGDRAKKRYVYVQLYPDADAARQRLERAKRSKRGLTAHRPPVFAVPGWDAVGWSIPNGPRLRVVRSFLKRQPFERFLERHGLPEARSERVRLPRLRRYVARRRALLKWRPRDPVPRRVWIKVYAPGEDAVAATHLTRLRERAGELAFRTPELLLHDPHRRAVLMSDVPGRPLTKLILRGRVVPWAATGTALASLHLSSVRPDRQWSPRAELSSLRHAIGDLSRALPSLTERLTGTMDRLETLASRLDFPTDAPIHANLFGDQLLWDGERVGLVDWDDSAAGDPLYDVGRLLAHHRFLLLDADGAKRRRGLEDAEALLAAYARRRGREPEPERLSWHIATALVLRAKISALRPLAEGWATMTARSLAEAERVLDAAGHGLVAR